MAGELRYDPITGQLLYKVTGGLLIYECPPSGTDECDCENIDTQAEFEAASAYLSVDIDVGGWQGDPTPWTVVAGTPTLLVLPWISTTDPGGPTERYRYQLVVGNITYTVDYRTATDQFTVGVIEDPFISSGDGGVFTSGTLDPVDPCGGNGDFTDFDSINYGGAIDPVGTFFVQLCL